jgi:hypothetical protein
MKTLSRVLLIIILVVFNVSLVYAMRHNPVFSTERFVISKNVIYREPVGAGNSFSADAETVFCFLEARDISEETIVSFVWYHGENEMAVVDLPLVQGSRWRTFSSKKLAGLTGNWRVELHDSEGHILETVTFSVE